MGYYRVHGKNYSLIPLEKYINENVLRFEISRQRLIDYGNLMRVDFNPDKWTRNSWYHRLAAAIKDISSVTPQNAPFILVDDNQWGTGNTFAGRPRLPFINNNGQYWGAPTEDIIAIGEIEREREKGAFSIVFAWTSFWWLGYYTIFHDYLKANYEMVLENENVIIFNLQKRLEMKPFETDENSDGFSTKAIKERLWLINKGFRTIIDVGANEGQFASKMRKLFPSSEIHSFEPIPDVYNKLLEHFKDDPKFFGYNYALGNKHKEAQIYLNEYSPSSSLLKMEDEHKKHFDFAKKESACNIVIKRIDDVMQIEFLQKPVLLKIDVQGFEEQVIQGGKMFIKGCEMIIIEVSFTELYNQQPLFHTIYKLLFTLGFKYSGNYEQLISPEDGSILQADAIFIK
ncbi:MAG: FkbM family methyltransferase [Segetibacter sp.]